MARCRMAGMRRGDKEIHFFGSEDLVRQHGREFSFFQLPNGHNLPDYPKSCFYNAYRAASRRNSKWIYVEGYAVASMGVPVHHAWLTRKDAPNTAFDPTWNDRGGLMYLGIPFTRDYVMEIRKSSRVEFYILDTYWLGWPLFYGKHKIEDVMESLICK